MNLESDSMQKITGQVIIIAHFLVSDFSSYVAMNIAAGTHTTSEIGEDAHPSPIEVNMSSQNPVCMPI